MTSPEFRFTTLMVLAAFAAVGSMKLLTGESDEAALVVLGAPPPSRVDSLTSLSADDWTVVFEDGFDSNEFDPNWALFGRGVGVRGEKLTLRGVERRAWAFCIPGRFFRDIDLRFEARIPDEIDQPGAERGTLLSVLFALDSRQALRANQGVELRLSSHVSRSSGLLVEGSWVVRLERAPLTTGRTYTVEMWRHGNTFAASIDGEQLLGPIQIPHVPTPARIHRGRGGLCVDGGTVEIDNVVVKVPR